MDGTAMTMSNFYEYLYGRVMAADDAPQGIRKHPDGSPCTAKSDETCPILRHEKRIDESDVLDPHLGEESRGTEGNETAESPEERARREYAKVVARYTNADGSKKRGWLKTPNGKDTNLDERQWVQVRTPSFKRWFGDWERLAELYAARDFALNGEPVAEVSGEDFQKDPTGANTLIDRVADYFAKIGGKAESPDLGTVELTREGAKSSVAHGIGSRKAAAFAAVKDVIEKGVVFDRNDNWKDRGYATATIVAPIRMGGMDYVCELVVNRHRDRNAFYLHEVNLKEKLSDTIKTATGAVSIGESARPVRSIIAQRLAEVNPHAVSKVIDENGEPKVVYHGARTNKKFTVFKNAETFFTDNMRIAEMFADEYAYRLVIDGKTYEINSREANDIAGILEPFYPQDILTPWVENGSNILEDVSIEQLNELLEDGSVQSWFDSFDGATEVRIEPAANKLFECFLNIRDPRKLDFGGKTWIPDVEGSLTDAKGGDGVIATNIVEGGYLAEIDGEEPPPATDYVVFSPSQIKSATDNTGAFSQGDDDIGR